MGEKGEWDLAELRAEFSELISEGAIIETSGFTLAEIDHVVVGEDIDAIEAGPLSPPADAVPIARVGDIFQIGAHRVICGDATKPEAYHQLLKGEKARLVLTDEPYNVPISGHVTGGAHREFVMASGEMSASEFAAFNESWIAAASDQLMPGGLLGTFIDWRGYAAVMTAAEKAGLAQLNLVVWVKTNGGMGSLYRSQHELLPLYKKGTEPHINNVQLGKNGRWRSNVWTYAGASSLGSDSRSGLQVHPTVKPVAMLEDALMDISNRGDIILDPFLGSGSTLIAAAHTRRICYGAKLDPLYVDVILQRLARLGLEAILEETGETLKELRERRAMGKAPGNSG